MAFIGAALHHLRDCDGIRPIKRVWGLNALALMIAAPRQISALF